MADIIRSYRDLEIWKMARELVVPVHKMTLEKLPKFEMKIFVNAMISLVESSITFAKASYSAPRFLKAREIFKIPKLMNEL